MKRFLLFTALLAIAGMTMAQDIWSAGYFTNSSGKKAAALYKNGDLQLNNSSTMSDHEGVAVVTHENVTYWAVNGTSSSGTKYAYVYPNTQGSSYLSTGDNTQINALFHRSTLLEEFKREVNINEDHAALLVNSRLMVMILIRQTICRTSLP